MSDIKRALIVLTPSESKRLIAHAVSMLPEVKKAKKDGRIIIAAGTTNAYIAGALTGVEIDEFWYAAGRIANGELGSNVKEKRIPPITLIRGEKTDKRPSDILEEFTSDDVFIKGANAIDHHYIAGVLMGDPKGGTIGSAIGIVMARGANLIVPVGLEKLIPSVIDAVNICGQGRFKYSMGDKIGMMPLVGAKVITEIEAIRLLYGTSALHIASGGISGGEGSVVLAVEGNDRAVHNAFESMKKLKMIS